MTDGGGRGEESERPSPEEDEKRREDKEKRSDELHEAWRRNHPSEEDERKGRPGNGGHR